MYSGALIGQRIQSSGFSAVSRPSIPAPAPTPVGSSSSSGNQRATAEAVAVAAAAAAAISPTDSNKPNLIQQQWSTIFPGANGKVTAECLLNACKAILIGTTLIAIGAAMATVGYYANELSLEEQTSGNLTVKVKNTSRGFHLNNLSYVGPIVMGFGGFILVAACVMTFEARDNASKIVPTRYLNKLRDTTVGVTDGGQINTSLFTNAVQLQWDVNRATPNPKLFQIQQQQQQPQPSADSWESSTGSGGELALTVLSDRNTLTADLLRFSKTLQQKCIDSNKQEVHRLNNNLCNLNRCPSAPDFSLELLVNKVHVNAFSYSPNNNNNNKWPLHVNVKRHLQANVNNNNITFLPRQAVSIDNPCNMATSSGNANAVPKSESDASMAMDLHFPDGSITLMVKDESKKTAEASNSPNSAQERKDTVKRPPLLRQCRVEHADSELEFNNPG